MTETKGNTILKWLQQNLVLVGIIILVVVTAIVEPKFLQARNLTNVMKQLSALPFVALGMTFVIICGFINLSVPGLISLVAVITALLINPLGQVGALLVGFVVGIVLGYITGVILTGCGAMIQAEVLFITYGLSRVFIAIAVMLSGAKTVRIKDSTKSISIFQALGSMNIGIFPLVFLIFVVILIIMHIFLTRTLPGRLITLVGGNKDAAFLAGYNVKKIMHMVYAICGGLTALGSLAMLARIGTAQSGNGTGYETDAILCVVVGGTSLKGGKGSVLRTMFGVALITLLGNCMNMLGLSTYMQTVMRGAVLVVAIWLDNRKTL